MAVSKELELFADGIALPDSFESTGISRRRRHRRPSGEAPPLPRQIQASGKYWLILLGFSALIWFSLLTMGALGQWIQRFDLQVLEWFSSLHNEVGIRIARAVHALGSDWTIRSLRWFALAGLLWFRRFRHLFVFLGSILIVGWLVTNASMVLARPRPLGTEVLGYWDGFSHPSRPIAGLSVTLMGLAYSMVVPERARALTKWGIAAVVGLLALARIYLGVDHPTDVVVGVVIGVAVPLLAFRMMTPNEVFPVSYKRGNTAHLDVSGARAQAIKRALADQLGIQVLEMEPVGLDGSAGSTPLWLLVEGDPDKPLFGKLYAENHLRSDRWYKLGRTLLYGRLEDEASFSTVRRLVQYEDYMLRLMRDVGIRTSKPFGFVEITPEREYLIVTEFLEGALEIGRAEVDELCIDRALATIRKLWDAGLAHRDIKPANVMVKDGDVFLIDVAFAQVRPSPWRQAVDLANMMLVLALRTDPQTVYTRALNLFTAQEIAESFAATQGVTMPSQLRAALKHDGRDLLASFRALVPQRPRISIQRWSLRRVALSLAVLLVALFAVAVGFGNLQGAGLL